MQSFAELGVSSAVVDALRASGITTPFAVQRLAIGDVLAGRDALVRSPTGSGKTLAFGVPLVDRTAADARRPAALVLAPTRELATQITDELRPIAHARALRVTAVYGGVGLTAQAKNAARSHILVATPGRLEDLLARGAFTLDAIRILVLDEADRMLDMGFKPAVDRIVRACPAERQTLFFSATLDGEAGRVARSYTTDPVLHEHGPTARRAAEDVEHRFRPLHGADRLDALVEQLSAERGLTLVFVRTKHGADRLVKRLSRAGIAAVAMHGNKSQRQREVALRRFETGAVDVLVATDVAARGIDVRGISHVINFDAPADHETYVHRVGRTGRAGRQGVAVTLVAEDQRREVAALADRLGLAHGLTRGVQHGARPGPQHAGPQHEGSVSPRPRRRRRRRPTRPASRAA
ncbi:MAG TPA: DEAD/DEAH box helicase [Solirubrobacteraceae bacterium]|nr:DEAD/DEAH box helicase [Solirubrobacteraceae bacterium]